VSEQCAGKTGQKDGSKGSEDATLKAADWLLKSATGMTLSKERKRAAGPVVHYAFGAVAGALYGGLVEYKRHSRLSRGALLGTALFIGADEIAVPALGLSQSPTEYPLSVHARALSAHLVYGLTAEAVRKKVRRALTLV
jgi:putative membrane protein